MDTKGNERADELAKIAAQKADANYDYEKIPLSGPQHKTPRESQNKAATLRTTTTERILDCAETVGKPGIQTRVALFMDRNTERPGIGFGNIATKLKAFTSEKQVFDNRGQEKASTSKKITNDSPKPSPKPTKADLGEVNIPVVMPVENPKDHMRNAFLKFAALKITIKDVTQTMCKNILYIYKKEDAKQLKQKLEENESTIYNNKSSQYIFGDARQNTVRMTHADWYISMNRQQKPQTRPNIKLQKTIQ
ncbi:hypothetical protein EVAR_4359_1 [Eumeta japonica]|uniref:RNase H type-1 domain-containing protein n=1 Tax=Eumeta variegata TaxID=151549 RepID=A0A4C1SJ69_EUMVA|nr:hypothetical protein EVAR_4359_1 [Eumeta japonica]